MPVTPAKYLINPLPAGGFPLESEDLLTLQDVPRAALNAALAGLGTCYVLSGCDLFDIDTDAGVCYVHPGYVFIDGEVRYFAGNLGGVYPFYVVSDTDSVTQKQFEDGNAKDTHVSLRTKIVPNKTLGVQSLTFNPTAQQTIANAITGVLAAALSKEISDREAAVATKQARVTSRIPWTDIVINTNSGEYFTADPNDANGRDYNKAQYMRTEDGIVHLRGYVKYIGTSGSGYISAQLPPAIQPAKPLRFERTYGFLGTGVTTHDLTISGNFLGHNQNFYPSNSGGGTAQNFLWLDGISYSVEA